MPLPGNYCPVCPDQEDPPSVRLAVWAAGIFQISGKAFTRLIAEGALVINRSSNLNRTEPSRNNVAIAVFQWEFRNITDRPGGRLHIEHDAACRMNGRQLVDDGLLGAEMGLLFSCICRRERRCVRIPC